MSRLLCFLLALSFAQITSSAGELRVPAFTAYILPDAESVRVSEQRGVTNWNGTTQSVNWYGKFSEAGVINATVELRLPSDQQSNCG